MPPYTVIGPAAVIGADSVIVLFSVGLPIATLLCPVPRSQLSVSAKFLAEVAPLEEKLSAPAPMTLTEPKVVVAPRF